MTNIDRIRSMDVGELAWFLLATPVCEQCANDYKTCASEDCYDGITRWLTMEVDEGAQ